MAKTSKFFKIDNLSLDDYCIGIEDGKKKYVSFFSNIYEKSIFFALERFGNNSEAFPSQKELARVLLCSKSQIEKSLKKLKDKNLIKIIKKKNRKSNTYETCNLEEKYLEVYGTEYRRSKKRETVIPPTINKELYKNNNDKIINKGICASNLKELGRLIDIIFFESKIRINNQTRKNIVNLVALKGISCERIKEVVKYVEKWRKGVGFLYKALKDNWILKDKKNCKSSSDISSKLDKSTNFVENKLEELKKLSINTNRVISLHEIDERRALELAEKEGISFEFLENMKLKTLQMYIRTLKNILDRNAETV